MLKKTTLLFIGLLLLTVRAIPEPQIPAPAGNPITLATSTAIRLVPNPKTAQPIMCNSVLIQVIAQASATGNVVYVLNADPTVTMTKDAAGTTTVAQLAGASTTAPGGSFTFPSTSLNQSGGFDLRYFGAQGTTGDQIVATCDLRQ